MNQKECWRFIKTNAGYGTGGRAQHRIFPKPTTASGKKLIYDFRCLIYFQGKKKPCTLHSAPGFITFTVV